MWEFAEKVVDVFANSFNSISSLEDFAVLKL
jgi:hypothetical protein